MTPKDSLRLTLAVLLSAAQAAPALATPVVETGFRASSPVLVKPIHTVLLPSVPAVRLGGSMALPTIKMDVGLPVAGAALPFTFNAAALSLPSSPIALPATASRQLISLPLGAGAFQTPGAASEGRQQMDADLNRVSETMANMAEPGKGGADGDRSSGQGLEGALTGERAAAASAEVAVPLETQVAAAKQTLDKILAEVGKVIVGQADMKKAILMAMVARQHVLLEGLPGVAKTETAKAYADAIEGAFQRVQATPDKLPGDILGSEVLQEDPGTGKKDFLLVKGPIFTNILLVDEINRMPPKAQAALLEAMAEGRVTIGRQTIDLGRFTVLATMNPIEQDGTYRMPEAQLDRFMLKVIVPQPSSAELKHIMRMNKSKDTRPRASKVTTLAELDDIRRLAESLTMTEDVEDYIVSVAMAASGTDMKESVDYTVYTRAAIYIAQAARVNALMRGSDFVTPADVREVAPLVLRHRISLSHQATGTGMTVEKLIQTILDRVEVKKAK